MEEFLTFKDTDLRNLKGKSKCTWMRFQDQAMPPGCHPERSGITFEIDGETGLSRLLVNKGMSYSGQNAAVEEWFISGEKNFTSIDDMIKWIKGPLLREYNYKTTTESSAVSNITDISAVHSGMCKINRQQYIDEEEIFEKLKLCVLGQDDALRSLASLIARHFARTNPSHPSVGFALGPSGVGKTKTVIDLSEILNEIVKDGKGFQLLRIDMNLYQEEYRISQLIGSPQGYAGYGEGSELINALRANPNTIVLFDEIEKAHPAILRVLMNAMDAGRLSSSSSSGGEHTVDCRYAIFLFTSNIDAKDILDELEANNAFGNRIVEDEVCRRRLHAAGIAPEIVGRIQRFLVYRYLTPETRAEIIALSIVEIAKEYGVQVSYIEPGVIVDLISMTRSQDFGVRPERFLIDEVLGGAFARAAKKGLNEYVKVVGPPYECEPN